MKICSLIVGGAVTMVFSHLASASQADDTTIRITGQRAGASPFISKVSLAVSNTSVLKNIQFTITPKPGSVTRPLSGTYANSYLIDRGFENPQTGEVVLPVYGLYDGFNNTVELTCLFLDGSSNQINTRITTATFNDSCGYQTPAIVQRRTNSTTLSYDYVMIKGGCSDFQPTILDTDGRLRWVGTADNVLISGFIVGDVGSATIIVRALGPSLARFGVRGALSDPTLTIYDSTGSAIATNDNWQDDPNAIDIQRNGLAPPNRSEAALVLRLPAGAYTAIVRGTNGGTGLALAEVYTLH